MAITGKNVVKRNTKKQVKSGKKVQVTKRNRKAVLKSVVRKFVVPKKVLKVIRPGSALEDLHSKWIQLSASQRKVLSDVADALNENKTEPKRVRLALLPKLVKAKRPMTGYMLFAHENRQRVVSEHPEWKITDIAKKLGEEWKALSEEQKVSFKSRKVENTTVKKTHKLDPAEKVRRAKERALVRLAQPKKLAKNDLIAQILKKTGNKHTKSVLTFMTKKSLLALL